MARTAFEDAIAELDHVRESERFVRTGGALMFDCIPKKHQAGLQRGEWLHLIHTLDGDGAGQLSWQTFKRGWMAHMR